VVDNLGVKVRLPSVWVGETLAQRVKDYARGHGLGRAEAVRQLLGLGLRIEGASLFAAWDRVYRWVDSERRYMRREARGIPEIRGMVQAVFRAKGG